AFTTGASLTGVTVTLTIASAHEPVVSQTRYVKASAPLKSLAGVYVTRPFAAFTLAVPCAGGSVIVTVRGSRLPSTSVSLAVTLIAIGVSSSVMTESGLATGASFTAVTLTVTSADPHAPAESQTW